jgi:uncharacterized protein (TIGR03437 family)
MKGAGVGASLRATAGRMDARPRQFRTGARLMKLGFFAAIGLAATTLAAQQPGAGLRKAIQSTLGAKAAATVEPVVQQAEFNGTAPFNAFGYAVAIDGPVAVVGAPAVYSSPGILGSGWIYIFAKTVDTWSLQASIEEPGSHSGFGAPVAVSGGTVGVGATGSTGAVYVYTQTGNTWSQQATLTAADGVSGDHFGSGLAVNGGTIVVGAAGKNNLAGAVYIFTQTGGAWSQQAELTAPVGATYDSFGASVAVSGGTVVVGAALHNHRAGAIYVFTQTGNQWSQQAELTPSDVTANDFFGNVVAVSGDTAVVGDSTKNTGRGVVYIFTRTGGTWNPPSELSAGDGEPNDFFGTSVAMSGGTVAVGAPYHNQSAGAVYMFTQNGAGWSQQAEVTASDAAPYDNFGEGVAVDGGVMRVGACPGDATPEFSAAYVFQLPIAAPVNGASLVAGPIAPGEVIALFTSLGPDGGVVASPSTDGLLPTQLGGVQVFFDGVAAPIFYAQKQQVNVQAPFELRNPTTQVHIEYNGAATWTSTVAVQPAAPAIFRVGGSAQALVLNQDGTWNSPSNPAPAGSVVALWGTGGGATIPAGITGGFTRLDSLAPLALPVTVMIGSTAIEATLSYHGAAPTLSTGVFQINFQIPAGAPARPSVSLSIAIGSVKSTDPPAGTTIALK